MSLDEKARKWFEQYTNEHPWVDEVVEKYGLDLPSYDWGLETDTAIPSTVNRAHFIEDVHFLKTLDEYVRRRLPQDFSSVLDAGIGHWGYVYAMAAFFRNYNERVQIIGIDNSSFPLDLAKRSIQNRNVEDVEAVLRDIKDQEGEYDVVVNLCPNLPSTQYVDNFGERRSAADFFYNIWERISEDGLFVMGLSYPPMSKDDVRSVLTPYFEDITINENPYTTYKSNNPIHRIITAKPKLSVEQPQS